MTEDVKNYFKQLVLMGEYAKQFLKDEEEFLKKKEDNSKNI